MKVFLKDFTEREYTDGQGCESVTTYHSIIYKLVAMKSDNSHVWGYRN